MFLNSHFQFVLFMFHILNILPNSLEYIHQVFSNNLDSCGMFCSFIFILFVLADVRLVSHVNLCSPG